jgi:hypothetical protein
MASCSLALITDTVSVSGRENESVCPERFHSDFSGMLGICTVNGTGPCKERQCKFREKCGKMK